MSTYDQQTFNSPNPFARYAHRNRLEKSIELSLSKLNDGKLLDYGCGSGMFVSNINLNVMGCAVGYEPFMQERTDINLPVYSKLSDIMGFAPFNIVTLFETIEHLSFDEFNEFLSITEKVISSQGGILMSAPIEIGPALVLKEFNRSISRQSLPEYHLIEFLKASIFGIPARRAEDIKTSHKGFDFRAAINNLSIKGWDTQILCFTPLPLQTWYGNSQVFLWAKKQY
jgi:2-polyprenyl-3-methyl-5-hydroxy-6-metoxy-1,4-benzoquinol methylase